MVILYAELARTRQSLGMESNAHWRVCVGATGTEPTLCTNENDSFFPWKVRPLNLSFNLTIRTVSSVTYKLPLFILLACCI